MTVSPRPQFPDDASFPRPGRGHRVQRSHTSPRPQALRVAAALAACPSLQTRSVQVDDVWLAVRADICTIGRRDVVPLGSARSVTIDEEYAGDELANVMAWLLANEAQARRLRPLELFMRLRGEATKGRLGSARRTQSDALHGLTNVPPGRPVRFVAMDGEDDESGA